MLGGVFLVAGVFYAYMRYKKLATKVKNVEFDDNNIIVGQHSSLGKVAPSDNNDIVVGHSSGSLQRVASEPDLDPVIEKIGSDGSIVGHADSSLQSVAPEPGVRKRQTVTKIRPDSDTGATKSDQIVPSELLELSSDEDVDLDDVNELAELDGSITSSYVDGDDDNDDDIIIIPGPTDMIISPVEPIISGNNDSTTTHVESTTKTKSTSAHNDSIARLSIAEELQRKSMVYNASAAQMKLQQRLKKRGNSSILLLLTLLIFYHH